MPQPTFEYRLAVLQQSRVTYINGEWAGRLPLQAAAANPAQGLESCVDVNAWLQQVGAEGWELVSVTVEPARAPSQENLTRLYLKRRRE
jgi:hypothetical protein